MRNYGNILKFMHSGVTYFGKIAQIQFQIPSRKFNANNLIHFLHAHWNLMFRHVQLCCKRISLLFFNIFISMPPTLQREVSPWIYKEGNKNNREKRYLELI